MAHKDADLERIEQLLKIMKENDLVEVEIKHDDDKILLKRAQPQQPQVAAAPVVGPAVPATGSVPQVTQTPQPQAAAAADLVEIKAPMVGTFYATPNPDAEPYVDAGSHVTGATVVCIIEAMKVMNEIKAETDGSIVEILAKSGQAVEYGQVLFRVKPD